MDPLALGRSVVEGGGWAAFFAVLILIAVGLFRPEPWWVPGWIYRKAEQRAALAEEQAERNATALEKNTEALGVVAKAASRERRLRPASGGRSDTSHDP